MKARPDWSPIWIALSDLLMCFLVIAITLIATKKDADAQKPKAEFLITAEWDVGTDADVDLWLAPPEGKPVFYASREVGCATLDRDSRGFLDNVVTLSDGSKVKVSSDKETITLRCVNPGRYDIGVNLFQYRDGGNAVGDRTGLALKVHVEITRLNPSVHVEWAGDVTLDRVNQTINTVSFDLAPNGDLALTDPPLTPITNAAFKQAGYPP